MTPSSPAPSKRRNQSARRARSVVAGVRCSGGVAEASSASSCSRRSWNGSPRRSRSPTQAGPRRRSRPASAGPAASPAMRRDGAAAAAPRSRAARPSAMTISPSSTQRGGQLRAQRLDELGEVAVERLLVAALDEDLVAVAEDQHAKAVPLRLEDPGRRPAGSRRRAWRASVRLAD